MSAQPATAAAFPHHGGGVDVGRARAEGRKPLANVEEVPNE